MEIDMKLVLCAQCGMPFAISEDKMSRLRKCHNTFYCPDGHSQSYVEKTEEERLRERVSKFEAAEQKRLDDLRRKEELARQRKAKAKKATQAKNGKRKS